MTYVVRIVMHARSVRLRGLVDWRRRMDALVAVVRRNVPVSAWPIS